MKNLSYCVDCKRIANFSEECSYCQSQNIKDLTRKAPVNVIGTKIKGRVLKVKDQMVEVLYIDENKNTYVKPFEAEKLKKVL
ncbi:hypothetical protein [Desulforamulus reducens]|nr:hypothetical protein [Desulforamulus reducens]